MRISPQHRPATWRAEWGRPILARKEEYRLRFKAERSFAWLGNFWRLLIRWERLSSVYQGFFTVAEALVCVRAPTPSAHSCHGRR